MCPIYMYEQMDKIERLGSSLFNFMGLKIFRGRDLAYL